MTEKSLLVVISGPSGSGKGTLCEMLRQAFPDLNYSISVTTRPPRSNEKDGVDYFFVSDEEFKRLLQKGEFLEWAEVYGHYYGTPRSVVESALASGRDVLLEIDIQGASKVRELFPEAVLIFIKPPSLDELSDRITKRGTDDAKSIDTRMSSARQELQAARKYDYVVENDQKEKAFAKLMELIKREKQARNKILRGYKQDETT